MARILMILVVLFLVVGCGPRGGVQGPTAIAVAAPPRISAVTDLGGVPVLSGNALDASRSDGRFTPGEWMRIAGDDLDDESTVVRIGAETVAVAARVDGGLLVRLPREIVPLSETPVTVTTRLGSDATTIRGQRYLIVSDTSANALRFFRTGTAPEGTVPFGFEPECDAVPFDRARFHARSGSGALLYAVAAAKDSNAEDASRRELKVVHLGAPAQPAEIATVPFSSVDGPVGMAVTGDGDYLVVLTQTELLVFDVLDEMTPRLLSNTPLEDPGRSEGGYGGMALVGDGERAVLLDGIGNRLVVVDLTEKQAPRLVTHLEVVQGDLPRLVDIVADESDHRVVHVAVGANLRLAKNLFHKFSTRLYAHLKSDDTFAEGQLISYRLAGDELKEIRRSALPPRTIPLHLLGTQNGDVLVSGTDFSVADLSEPDSVMGGVRMAVGVLADAVKLGAILRIDSNGNVAKEADGVSLFLSLAEIPGKSGVVSLVLRVAVKKFPPSVGAQLSLDVLDAGGKRISEQKLRELTWTFVIPPYTTPLISF